MLRSRKFTLQIASLLLLVFPTHIPHTHPSFSLLKQGAVQEKEECKSDLVTSQDPSVQEWLAQAQTTRSQQQLSILQRQKVSMLHIINANCICV